MKKTLLLLCVIASLLMTTHQANAQITLSGVTMPATMKAGNTDLILNGAGMRVKFFIDIYVGGLYLTAKNNNGEAICGANEPTAVRVHIVSGLVSSARMKDAILDGFKRSTSGNMTPLQARIDKFVKMFSLEPIVKGDEFDLVYIPGEGVKVYKNGKALATKVEGLDFKTALWGVWVGKEPSDKRLKEGMLGAK